MKSELWKRAEELASLSYQVKIIRDITTDGDPIYLADNPELLGCMAQGGTEAEAENNLRAARIDYIYSLLDDGLPVPYPGNLTNLTTTSVFANSEEFEVDDGENTPANRDEILYNVIPVYSD